MGLLSKIFGDQEKAKRLERARDALKSNDDQRAIEAYESVLSMYSSNVEALVELANLYVKTGTEIPRAKRMLWQSSDLIRSRSETFLYQLREVSVGYHLLTGPLSNLELFERAPSSYVAPDESTLVETPLLLALRTTFTFGSLKTFLSEQGVDRSHWEWRERTIPSDLSDELRDNVLARDFFPNENFKIMGVDRPQILLDEEVEDLSSRGKMPLKYPWIPGVEFPLWDHVYWRYYDWATQLVNIARSPFSGAPHLGKLELWDLLKRLIVIKKENEADTTVTSVVRRTIQYGEIMSTIYVLVPPNYELYSNALPELE